METRKVQLSGGTTYTISLPKSWASEHDIDAGSTVSLYPNGDGTLLVEGDIDKSTSTRSARLDISTADADAVQQQIYALHAIGVDSVTLFFNATASTETRVLVEDTVSNLSGFELLEGGDTRIRLTNLIDADNVDIRKSTLRLRLVMLGMHRDAVSAVLDDDETLAQRVSDRDNEADKLFAMVTRHFRRALASLQEVQKLGYSRDELFEFYYISRQFERIADHAEKIARFAVDPEATVPREFVNRIDEVASSARQIVDTAADVILSDGDIQAAHTALATRSELTSEIRTLDRDLYTHNDPAEAYVVGLLLDSVRRTAEYGGNVADIAIQRVTRESKCVE